MKCKNAVAFVLNIFSTEKFNRRENVAFAANDGRLKNVFIFTKFKK